MNTPIKRNEFLQPLSREHHHGLLLCWKIRTGLKKGIDAVRIKAYADWFYRTWLLPHFDMEEKHVFTLPGLDPELIQRAIAEHRRLKQLFESGTHVLQNLERIERELDQHIRFEERVLFNAVQEKATPAQLQSIARFHTAVTFTENTDDPFWE